MPKAYLTPFPLTVLCALLPCSSCNKPVDGISTTASLDQVFSELEAIDRVKEAIESQTPFGITTFNENELEVTADLSETGDWVVSFDYRPSTPGAYFFAILTPDGKVEFWPGK